MSDAKADPTVITRAQRGADKVARIPVKVEPTIGPLPRKPAWIKAKAPTDPKVIALKQLLRDKALHTVCEEASCPNLGECFAHGVDVELTVGAGTEERLDCGQREGGVLRLVGTVQREEHLVVHAAETLDPQQLAADGGRRVEHREL